MGIFAESLIKNANCYLLRRVTRHDIFSSFFSLSVGVDSVSPFPPSLSCCYLCAIVTVQQIATGLPVLPAKFS